MKKFFAFFLGLGASAVLAQEPSVIYGKLLGYDGQVMPRAHVYLMQPGQGKALISAEVGKDGKYELRTERTGLLTLVLTGVNHLEHEVLLIIDRPVRTAINVRLKPYEYNDDLTDLKIIGDFNNFSFQTAKPMVKQADGTYTFEMTTPADKFAYQLIGLEKSGRSVNGTQSDDYVYDGGGDYKSVVSVENGRVKIIFDPKQLIRPIMPVEAQVDFEDKNSRLAQLYALEKESRARREKFFEAVEAHKKTNPDMRNFSYDWSAEASALEQKIAAQSDPPLRQFLLLSYIELGGMYGENLNRQLAVRALEEIPPASPLWSKMPQVVFVAINLTGEREKYSAYIDSVLSQSSDPNVKSTILFIKLREAHSKREDAKFKKYYDRLVGEYGETNYAMLAKSLFSPERKIIVGKPLPAFSVSSLDNPAMKISNQTLKGKIYLIDFWAVWCGPCIAEMENLHQAYEKFHDQNFEILSLSFDGKPEDVIKFRQERWKMPWLHAFVEGGLQSELAKQFEVIGIPKPILVNAEGLIIATEIDLRGPNLEKTLAGVFGSGNAEK